MQLRKQDLWRKKIDQWKHLKKPILTGHVQVEKHAIRHFQCIAPMNGSYCTVVNQVCQAQTRKNNCYLLSCPAQTPRTYSADHVSGQTALSHALCSCISHNSLQFQIGVLRKNWSYWLLKPGGCVLHHVDDFGIVVCMQREAIENDVLQNAFVTQILSKYAHANSSANAACLPECRLFSVFCRNRSALWWSWHCGLPCRMMNEFFYQVCQNCTRWTSTH